jgi:hypothetical protein
MVPRRSLALLLLALSALPTPLRAERPAWVRAARAFAQARRLFEARRYVRAAAAFEEAYRLRPHFLVLCSVARCHENMSNMVQAAAYYRRCLDGGAARTRLGPRIRASLASVERQVSWILVSTPDPGGAVVLGDGELGHLSAAGDMVFIDGKKVGPAPGRYPVNPGRHVVEVRRAGARAASHTLTTLGGEDHAIRLAPLDITRQPEPEVLATTIRDRPRRRRRGLGQTWFWVAAAATAALATTTAVLGAQTLDKRSSYEAQPTRQGYDSFTRHRTLTNVFGAVTAAAGGGTILLYFFTDFHGEREEGPRVSSIGVNLGGRF